jgi:hypothetical protein
MTWLQTSSDMDAFACPMRSARENGRVARAGDNPETTPGPHQHGI